MNIITTYYNSGNYERNAEIIFCIRKNIENKTIKTVHVLTQCNLFVENFKMDCENDKLFVTFIEKRPTFNDLFIYGEKELKNEIKIVCNSDIFFDYSIEFASLFLKKYKMITLTRWNVINQDSILFHTSPKSQDVWIYKESMNFTIGQFHIGTPKCDNKLLYEIRFILSWNIYNPSFKIKAMHLHNSEIRNYSILETIESPILYIMPSITGVLRSIENINLYIKQGYRFNRNIFLGQFNDSIYRSKVTIIKCYFKSKIYAFLLKCLN
jgi:hypothetical protein